MLDEHGYLTITDRVKDIIIRGGENISAAEVEQALQTLPGVAEIAVVAAPDERLGEHACAIVRMLPGAAPVTLGDVTAHLSGVGLARQKWPEELRLVDDFPRTASGKIRKVDLRAWLRSESDHARRTTLPGAGDGVRGDQPRMFMDWEMTANPFVAARRLPTAA